MKGVTVHVPTPLRSYTERQSVVQVEGTTLAEVLSELDRRYPGLRFRIINEQNEIREHIKVFVNQQTVPDLSASLHPGDDVRIITAISGG